MARGFSGTLCEITARVSASTFSVAWQQGHSTSNITAVYHPIPI
jgi:hypothetical protein